MKRLISILLSCFFSSIAFAAPATQPAKPEEKDFAAAAAAQAALDKSLPAVNFTQVSFEDAIDFFRDVTGANIYVNWRALQAAGINRDAQVNMKVRNVSLRKVLSLLLSEVSTNNAGLSYQLDDGVIMISTVEDLGKRTFIRVYDVRDLLDPKQVDKKGTILMNLIMGSIVPESWVEFGGKSGTCKFLNAHLIITKTRINHEAIENLLSQLREFQK